MIEWLGTWLLGISAAGIVSGLCVLLAPENGKKAVRFAGGLFICLAVLLPIRSLEGYDPSEILKSIEMALETKISGLTNNQLEDAEEILTLQTEDYIEARIASYGHKCTASVIFNKDFSGTLFPYSLVLKYASFPLPEDVEEISALIEAEFGIPISRQYHK